MPEFLSYNPALEASWKRRDRKPKRGGRSITIMGPLASGWGSAVVVLRLVRFPDQAALVGLVQRRGLACDASGRRRLAWKLGETVTLWNGRPTCRRLGCKGGVTLDGRPSETNQCMEVKADAQEIGRTRSLPVRGRRIGGKLLWLRQEFPKRRDVAGCAEVADC